MYYDRGAHYEFLSLLQELAAPGEMRNNQSFDFEFKNVEKQYESYHGINVKLRYLYPAKNCLTVGISSELQSQGGWPMSYERRTFGCTHTSLLLNQTVPSKWMLGLRTAFTSNLNIPNQSKLPHE